MNEIFKIYGSILLQDEAFIKGLQNALDKAEQTKNQMAQKFEQVGQAFGKIGQGITKAGTVMTATLTTGIAGLATAGIKYNMELENFHMNLTTLLGSSEKATKLLDDLKTMAATTPFETNDLIAATQTMIGFGIASNDAQKYLGYIGDIAMGDANKLSGLSLAFSQVQSTGKLTGQDLLQMVNQGFNPLKYISDMTGKSMATLKEEMADGAISAEMVADAFEYATSQGQPFYKGMENGAKTVSGRISTLKDNFMILIGNLTESLLPTFEKIVDKLTQLTDKFMNLSDEQKDQILKWAGIVAATGPVLIVVGKLVSGFGGLLSIIGKVKGMGGLAGLTAKFSALLPVIGPVVGIIAGVVAVLALLVHALGGPKEALEKLKDAFAWCKEVIADFLEKINFNEKLEGIKNKFSELSEKLKGLKDLFIVIGTVIGGALAVAFGILSGLFNAVLNAIEPLLTALGGIIDILAGIGSFIVAVFTGDWQKAWDSVKKIASGIKDVFVGLWEAIQGLLGDMLEGMWSFFKSLADKIGITDFLIKVKNKISEWWNNFVEWCKTAWTNICSFFIGWADWINAKVVRPIINFFQSMWEGIKAVWDGICLAVEIAIKLIASILDAAFQIITLPFRFIWENCKEYVYEFIDTIKTWIGNVVTWVVDTFNALKEKVLYVWGLIKQYIIQPVIDVYNRVKEFIGMIVSWIVGKFNELKTKITNVWNTIKTFFTNVITAIVDFVKQRFENLKNNVITVVEAIKSFVSKAWEAIKTYIVNPVKNAYETVKAVFTNLKNKAVEIINSLKERVSEKFNQVKEAITKPIERAKETVRGIINNIKDFFKFKVELPKIKLPHFSIKPKGWELGDLLKGSIPKLAIDWYAKGGIFDKPTIFPTASGMKGVGEAGPEAVTPISALQKYVQVAVDNSNTGLEERLDILTNVLLNYLPLLTERQIVMDTGQLVGSLVNPMDKALGDKSKDRRRGR